jgi:hypothetical protein
VSVIRDHGEIRAYYGGQTRCESVPFNVTLVVRSARQECVHQLGGPVLGYSPDEPFVLSGPKIRRYHGLWYLWYVAGRKWKMVEGRAEPVYKIRMATSQDGIHWTRLNKDLIESRVEEDEAQASPDVFYANGKYHMLFCYRYSSHYFQQGERIPHRYASTPT